MGFKNEKWKVAPDFHQLMRSIKLPCTTKLYLFRGQTLFFIILNFPTTLGLWMTDITIHEMPDFGTYQIILKRQ